MIKTIKHHLTDELLMGYSAGTLPEAFNLVVATHISLCDECRAHLASFDAVGGELVARADAVDLAEDSLQAVMAMISSAPEPANDDRAQAPVRKGGIFPTPARRVQGRA